MLTGIFIRPDTLEFVTDSTITFPPSEIGIMLLMFGVDLHFSIQYLLAFRWVPCWDNSIGDAAWSDGQPFLDVESERRIGIRFVARSCASTLVLFKALASGRTTESINDKITAVWLVAEDMLSVLMLVLIVGLLGNMFQRI